MFIPLYRKTFEPPLPNVTAATIVLMITPHMACQQPLRKLTQVLERDESDLQQAKGQELNPMSFLGFS